MRITLIGLGISVAGLIPAQVPQSDAPLNFEVATIKPSQPGGNGVRGGCHGIDSVYTPAEQASAPPLGRCLITDGRLSHLVGIAWDITMPMLKTGPDWIQRSDERFSLQAKAENPTKTTQKELLQMLQALLIQRFNMKYHLEPVEMRGFGLTVAKGGSKLRESTSEESGFSFGRGGKPVTSGGTVTLRRYSVGEFVTLLSLFGDRGPGVDHTGLTGLYDFSLTWDNENGPALETALREQLGLHIDSEKVSTSYFVIDSASHPSEN